MFIVMFYYTDNLHWNIYSILLTVSYYFYSFFDATISREIKIVIVKYILYICIYVLCAALG